MRWQYTILIFTIIVNNASTQTLSYIDLSLLSLKCKYFSIQMDKRKPFEYKLVQFCSYILVQVSSVICLLLGHSI
ncbi:hypothetical protein TSAR_007249 [Trichomalopsis sarcophagae]|uniref:Uncharacterized protein n=1 Tax=Trichomalopsis sarcophagae TaxID=543379 RepID=A0A232ETM7_9HYME|nr:hypothetical protein TSAR_007249 [Trichomalopsis sarcophagae]